LIGGVEGAEANADEGGEDGHWGHDAELLDGDVSDYLAFGGSAEAGGYEVGGGAGKYDEEDGDDEEDAAD